MTHILENVDRKNEYLNSPKTHNTNSILIQNCSDDQVFTNCSCRAKLLFSRKDHKSFRAKTATLLDINFKRGIPKLIPSIIEVDQNKEFQNSSKKILGWVLLRNKTAHPS